MLHMLFYVTKDSFSSSLSLARTLDVTNEQLHYTPVSLILVLSTT